MKATMLKQQFFGSHGKNTRMPVHCARRAHAQSCASDAARDLSITHCVHFLSARTQSHQLVRRTSSSLMQKFPPAGLPLLVAYLGA